MAMLTAFWAVSILFVVTPGADWACAITAGMHERAIVPAVGGLLLGHLTATIIVAVGVGALVANTPLALALLTIAGSIYLLWLGFGVLKNPPVPAKGLQQGQASWGRWTIRGFGVSGLNPKVFLLFLALLPQFTDRLAPWPLPAQIIGLGMVHVVNCGIVYLLVGFGSKTILRTRPQVAEAVSRLSGAIMMAIAGILLFEQFFR